MGVLTLEVGYTSAITGKGDHEVHKGRVVTLPYWRHKKCLTLKMGSMDGNCMFQIATWQFVRLIGLGSHIADINLLKSGRITDVLSNNAANKGSRYLFFMFI
jgi:hypothetical protein